MVADAWKNRIVGHGTKPASEFLAHPLNWRAHPKAQQAAVVASLNSLGWIAEVIENARTGHLLDGHERIWEALARGDDTPVPFVQVDIDEAEEALALAVIDPISAMATADTAKLDELLREISTGDAALQAMLAELAEKSEVTPPNVDFREYDEAVENEVEYITCPECGHRWPK